ncbi:MAG: PDZ domain-containing protein [Cocleimonas sp.]
MKIISKSILTFGVLLLSVASSAQPSFYPAQNQMPYGNPQYAQPAMQPFAYVPQGYPTYMMAPQAQRQQQAQPRKPTEQKPFREFSGYLGLVTDILPSSVSAQLPKGNAQGILFKSFSDKSPARNSDLKPFDVIVEFNKQKVIHPAQFIKSVRAAEPGKTVNLKVVRQGVVIDIPVTVGAQKTPNPKEFNGLAIKQIGEDKYRAIIRFVGANGNKQMRTYEGDREEIFQQAMDAQDLPKAEREQLLYATRPRNNKSNNGFGSFFPFSNNSGNNGSGSNNWMNPSKYFKPKMPW